MESFEHISLLEPQKGTHIYMLSVQLEQICEISEKRLDSAGELQSTYGTFYSILSYFG
jgi:hypothetical protein